MLLCFSLWAYLNMRTLSNKRRQPQQQQQIPKDIRDVDVEIGQKIRLHLNIQPFQHTQLIGRFFDLVFEPFNKLGRHLNELAY